MLNNQTQPQSPAGSLDDVYSLDDFQKKHADILTKSQLQWYLRNRENNGLAKSGAVIVSARKYYLVESAFTAWFLSQSKKS
jgi:hypothetical protein